MFLCLLDTVWEGRGGCSMNLTFEWPLSTGKPATDWIVTDIMTAVLCWPLARADFKPNPNCHPCMLHALGNSSNGHWQPVTGYLEDCVPI